MVTRPLMESIASITRPSWRRVVGWAHWLKQAKTTIISGMGGGSWWAERIGSSRFYTGFSRSASSPVLAKVLEYLRDYHKHATKLVRLKDRAHKLYKKWPERDQHIFDLYALSIKWRTVQTQEDRQFIDKIKGISNDDLAEELRIAREKSRALTKMRSLKMELAQWETPERRKVRKQEWRKRYRQNLKEKRRLQAEQQPTQVFPSPAEE